MLWAVSRAPLAKLQAYKRRMGWTFPWASSAGSDFNPDFGVDDVVYHTYSAFARGCDAQGVEPHEASWSTRLAYWFVLGRVATRAGVFK